MNKQPLADRSDEELMLEYKLGNFEAFEALYQRHAKKLYGYLGSKLNSKVQIEDVYQETMLCLHRHRERYDASFPFLPWLFTICRNAMVDYLRKVGRNKTAESGATTEIDMESSSGAEELHGYIQQLSPAESQVVQLHHLRGYSFDEVAAHLKIQPSNARKISSRALQKLKSIWKSGL